MNRKEKKVRQKVRGLIREELSPAEKSSVLDDLELQVKNVVNSVLIDHGVHKKGLSDQQEAKLYREICKVIDEVLDQYKTTRKPSEIENLSDYEDYMDLV